MADAPTVAATGTPEVSVDVIKAWQCIGCGRLDAPQNCVGICQDRKVDLVLFADYAAACAGADRLAQRVQLLEAVLRQLAFTTPRDGEWQRSYESLQGRARQALVPSAG